MMMKSTMASFAAVSVLVALSGCGGSTTDSETPDSSAATEETPSAEEPSATPTESSAPAEPEAEPEEVVITITDFEFVGPESVAPGATVTVINEDNSSHTATSADGEDVFDVALAGGETGTFTAPQEPGDYAYVCTYHPEMTATLVVR